MSGVSANPAGLSLRGLRLQNRAGDTLLDGVDLSLERGRCLALLGESGSGKSLTSLALMRLLPEGLRVSGGQALVKLAQTTEDLLTVPEAHMRTLRGGQLAMIFQEPMTSLNPVLRIGQQIAETARAHGLGAADGESVDSLLNAVGLPVEMAQRFPFQLSGGQRQRALIAVMLAAQPDWLIADEPSTALDVTTQAQILRLLREIQRRRGMGLLLITHDLDIARAMADEVAVMYAGQIVEQAPVATLFAEPRHPYTQALLAVLPAVAPRGANTRALLPAIPGQPPQPHQRRTGCAFAPRCPHRDARCVSTPPPWEATPGAPDYGVRCHHPRRASFGGQPAEGKKTEAEGRIVVPNLQAQATAAGLLEVEHVCVHFPQRRGLLQRVVGHTKAVDGVSLQVHAGETLALVGESGCGKTTLARAILGLLPITAGHIRIAGQDLAQVRDAALPALRRRVQIVFQDPFASLNPRRRIGETLDEGLQALGHVRAGEPAYLAEVLASVGLDADALTRYPHAFSGGQRQRIAIARALAVEPDLLICDEPTSALDVSVQAQILNLLRTLQAERGLAYLFISHNVPVVGYLADRIAVMQGGRIVEAGDSDAVLHAPQHPYTQALLAAAPKSTPGWL